MVCWKHTAQQKGNPDLERYTGKPAIQQRYDDGLRFALSLYGGGGGGGASNVCVCVLRVVARHHSSVGTLSGVYSSSTSVREVQRDGA